MSTQLSIELSQLPSQVSPSPPDQITDDQLIALFFRLKFQRSKSEHTVRAYRTDINRFRSSVTKPLAQVTVSDLLNWVETLDDLAPASRARSISSVRSLYRVAQRTGYIRFNPSEILDRPDVPITSGNRFLIRSELESLFRESKSPRRSPHLYPALVLMATTALRVSELLSIQWKSFFQDMHEHIGLTVEKGKGSKTRTVKITPEVWSVIASHRKHFGLAADLDAQDDSYLFPGAIPGKPLACRTLQKAIASATRKAGIRKKVSPHWLRHTSITLALVGGARVEQAQAMAGHSDLRTTTRYAHTAQQLKETATDYIRLDL